MACCCDSLFRTLSEDGRSRIITHLLSRADTITGISDALGYEQSRTSHAVKVLAQIGIVTKERRGREMICRIDERIEPVLRKLEDLRTQYHEAHCAC